MELGIVEQMKRDSGQSATFYAFSNLDVVRSRMYRQQFNQAVSSPLPSHASVNPQAHSI